MEQGRTHETVHSDMTGAAARKNTDWRCGEEEHGGATRF